MQTEEKNKTKGLITTVLIHALLLILFAFFGMSYTIPPPEEEGITINLGFVDAGSGEVQSSTTETVEQEEVVEEVEPEVVEATEAQEEYIEQSVEESAAITEKKEEKVVEEKKEEVPEPDKKMSAAINKWKNKKDTKPEGDGTTDQAGDQGAVNGDPNSKSYVGGGNGNGTQWSLGDRGMISTPKIEDKSQKEGKVVVDIIVDKVGNVLRASPGARGSTTTDPTLYKKAKEAALKTKFSTDPNAPEEQKGTMTFIFILN